MSIYPKLLELQKTVGAVTKDSKNPYFNSAYFDINKLIEVLKPTLNTLGLVVYQPVEHINGESILKTLVVDSETGEKVESSIALPSGIEPQKMGSAITYLRRYTLQSLLFLQAEDDDGSAASPKNISKPSQYPQTAQQVKKVIQNPNVEAPF